MAYWYRRYCRMLLIRVLKAKYGHSMRVDRLRLLPRILAFSCHGLPLLASPTGC